MVIGFPKRDIIGQEELAPVCAVEAQLDEILEILYKCLAAGASIEPGAFTGDMRRQPIQAVEENECRVG